MRKIETPDIASVIVILSAFSVFTAISMRIYSVESRKADFKKSIITRAQNDKRILNILDSKYQLGDYLSISTGSEDKINFGYLVDFTESVITLESLHSTKRIKRKLVSSIEEYEKSSLACSCQEE